MSRQSLPDNERQSILPPCNRLRFLFTVQATVTVNLAGLLECQPFLISGNCAIIAGFHQPGSRIFFHPLCRMALRVSQSVLISGTVENLCGAIHLSHNRRCDIKCKACANGQVTASSSERNLMERPRRHRVSPIWARGDVPHERRVVSERTPPRRLPE